MSRDEREEIIKEIIENLRQLGLVSTEDTACNHEAE